MAKALRKVKEKVGNVDLIIEVRDARIPLTSGNSSIHEIIGNKPRLIVLNKSNLAEEENIQRWKKWFSDKKQAAVFINSMESRSLRQLTKEARKMMRGKWESFKKKGIRPPPLRMMILGIPNTGKSTIINRLTKRNAVKTGDCPGVTRSQDWIVLDKDLELLDTPGIMPPRIETEEQGMWLCAVHAIKDEIVGKEKVAIYIVSHLMVKESAELKSKYRLKNLDCSAEELLLEIGTCLNFKKLRGEIDLAKTSSQVLIDFRKGALGGCSFEMPPEIWEDGI
ncbi:ribosome biogenesis GTPase YlqF [bacterium]|nr:ribosome biogenesis GTPase YlqF [bacterium]